MAMLNAQRFLEHIGQDQTLQTQVENAGWNTAPVVRLGASHGFIFTMAELQTAFDDLWGTVSEEELRNAAGGKNDKVKAPKDGGGDNLSPCSFFHCD